MESNSVIPICCSGYSSFHDASKDELMELDEGPRYFKDLDITR